jgi:hypothetical protein
MLTHTATGALIGLGPLEVRDQVLEAPCQPTRWVILFGPLGTAVFNGHKDCAYAGYLCFDGQ